MFEVNLFTPAQFGAFIPWLVINRGPLSALVHPNTDTDGEEERNHTQRATWLGDRFPLDLSLLKMGNHNEEKQKSWGRIHLENVFGCTELFAVVDCVSNFELVYTAPAIAFEEGSSMLAFKPSILGSYAQITVKMLFHCHD
jgi:Dopa 4,5-dioxygenase family